MAIDSKEVRSSVVTMAAALLAYGAALALERAEHLSSGVIVLAVVLALSIGRRRRGSSDLRVLALIPVVAIAASEVGHLMARDENAGDALFVAILAGGIWLRRFGPVGAKVGTLAALPLIAGLVAPVPPSQDNRELWAAVVAAIAFASVALTQLLAERAGFVERPRSPAPVAIPRRDPKRMPASTKMAAQMAVALAAAFAVGRWLFPGHWTWIVLTAFIVGAGNQGRGDVVYKSGQRIAGAAAGTIVATVLAGAFDPGDWRSVAVIFAVLSIATYLRSISYAYWAAGVTSVLSLLYGYFGQTGTDLLPTRLGAIGLGAVLAIAAAWLVLPIRTSDVVRLRRAEALYALRDRDHARIAHAVERLRLAARPLDVAARLGFRGETTDAARAARDEALARVSG
jgi:uncharacterized membrane protein YccC